MRETWLNQISPVLRPPSLGRAHTGQDKCGAHYADPPRIIYDHELVLYAGSTFHVETENGFIDLAPDSFVILPPGLLHAEINSGGKAGKRFWCHFDWEYQPDYEVTPVMTYLPGDPQFRLCRSAPGFVPAGILYGPLPDPEAAWTIARNLGKTIATDTPEAYLQSRWLLLRLLVCVLHQERPTQAGIVPVQNLASAVRQKLNENIAGEYSMYGLRGVLSAFDYSYEHLSRVFRRTYGVSPMQYVRAQQLVRAQFLLRNTTLQVGEIGRLVGFANPAYFTKVFRQKTGQTPMSYRRRSQ